MASGLNMKVLLELQTKQFNKGINEVKRSMNGLKNTFKSMAAALAGGLGLSKVVSDVRETAMKLSVAQNTLRNVSNTFTEYADSTKFIQRISNDYAQDVISLTNEFAKFRAAAKESTLSLDEQRDVFESLTRAAGAYHLSADQTTNVMMAVTQMISKGKVTAEELRRQLGNTLPGAFNLMAKAAQMAGLTTNDTTAELEELMRKGKLMTDDVLPAFGQALDAATSTAGFDSLQSSVNRLHNAWTDFVKSGQFEAFFKGITDIGVNALTYLTQHFTAFSRHVTSMFAGVITALSFKGLSKAAYAETAAMKKQLAEVEAQIEKNIAAGKALYQEYVQLNNTKEGKLRLHALIKEEAITEEMKRDYQQIKVLENGREVTAYKLLSAQEKAERNMKEMMALTKELTALEKQKVNLTNTTNKSLGVMGTIGRGLTGMFKSLGVAIKGALSAIGITLFITLLTEAIQKTVEWYKEWKKNKEYVDTVVGSVNRISDATQINIGKVKALQTEYEKLVGMGETSEEIEKRKEPLINKLNKALGLAKGKYLTIESTLQDINTQVDNWVQGQLKLAKAAAVFGKIEQLQSENIDMQMRNEEITQNPDFGKKKPGFMSGIDNVPYYEVLTNKARKLQKKLEKNKDQIDKNNQAMEKLFNIALTEGLDNPFDTGDGNGNGDGDGGGGSTKTKKKVKDVLDAYTEALTELSNQRKRGAIDEAEYNKEIEKTTEKYWKELAAFEDLEEQLAKLGADAEGTVADLKAAFANIQLANEIEKSIDEAQKAFEKEMDELLEKEEEYRKKLFDIWDTPMPVMASRDSFFDYKKSGSEMFGEGADIADDYVKALEDRRDMYLELMKVNGALGAQEQKEFSKLLVLLEKAKAGANTLRKKVQVEEWIEDVKDLHEEYQNLQFDNFKNFASSFDKIASSTHRMAEAFATLADEELSQETQEFFNKLDAGISIMNEMISLWEFMINIVEGMKKAQEAYQAVQEAVGATEALMAAQKLGYLTAEQAAEVQSATATVAAETTKQAAVGATTTALAGEAIVGAASSQASIPYIGPILAAAAVAGIVALMAASMSKFAKGGLVSGNSTQGDNNFVRANSGELILTKSQQGTLFEAIKSGNLGGNGGEWRVRGTDLIKVINNTQNRIKG